MTWAAPPTACGPREKELPWAFPEAFWEGEQGAGLTREGEERC